MGWTCRRPGCHREAAVTIGYDPVSCQVWLDPLGSGPPPAQMLCLDHAERLQPPRGWVVVDRRSPQTVIVSPSNAPRRPTVGRAPRRVPRRWGQIEEQRLEFTVDPAVEPLEPVDEPVPLADPDPAPAPEPEPAPAPEPEPAPEPVVELPPEPETVLDLDRETASLAEPEPEPEPEPESGPEAVPAAVAPERADDLEALMQPRGRLLSRAFEAGRPHRNLLLDPEE